MSGAPVAVPRTSVGMVTETLPLPPALPPELALAPAFTSTAGRPEARMSPPIPRRSPAMVLTSDPSREAANRLYQRLGFALGGTNYYWRGL